MGDLISAYRNYQKNLAAIEADREQNQMYQLYRWFGSDNSYEITQTNIFEDDIDKRVIVHRGIHDIAIRLAMSKWDESGQFGKIQAEYDKAVSETDEVVISDAVEGPEEDSNHPVKDGNKKVGEYRIEELADMEKKIQDVLGYSVREQFHQSVKEIFNEE